jgi:hypothetical protein
LPGISFFNTYQIDFLRMKRFVKFNFNTSYFPVSQLPIPQNKDINIAAFLAHHRSRVEETDVYTGQSHL